MFNNTNQSLSQLNMCWCNRFVAWGINLLHDLEWDPQRSEDRRNELTVIKTVFMAGYVVLRPGTLHQTKTLCGTLTRLQCPRLGRMSLLCPACKDNPHQYGDAKIHETQLLRPCMHQRCHVCSSVSWLQVKWDLFRLWLLWKPQLLGGILTWAVSGEKWPARTMLAKKRSDVHNRKAVKIFTLKNLRT